MARGNWRDEEEYAMLARGQHFTDARMVVDGDTFEECTFERCTLIYSAMLPTQIAQCHFKDTKWEFAGPARNTLNFLTELYASGGKALVETAISRIRGSGRSPPASPLN
jgi:hypothetical protein